MSHLVAIPVYNEQRHVEHVLRAVQRHTNHILVINDGSTDDTGRLLRRWPSVHTVTHLENRGYGQSLIDAFGHATRHGYDWVITIDCDEQHEPQAIPEFVAAMRRDQADVLSGSRYLIDHPHDDPPPPERRRINRTVCTLLQQLLDLRLTDAFCGFKAYRVSAMRRLRLSEPGYAFPLQFWVQCARARLHIDEIPVRRVYRDRSRRFGGTLDDPRSRLQHYLEVLVAELCSGPDLSASRRPLTDAQCR